MSSLEFLVIVIIMERGKIKLYESHVQVLTTILSVDLD